MKAAKTNAARLLDTLNVTYTLHNVPVSEDDLSATTVAMSLKKSPSQVFKTLVCRGDKTGVLMACIPADKELNLKALAAASHNKNVAMVHLKEVFGLTGYIRGGCSPLAAKKEYPVYIDASCQNFDCMFVSAGKRGVQLELAPNDLVAACHATLAPLTRLTEEPAE